MASAGQTPHRSARHKSLDAEINLVPFIDLLSMCICFLLMTAVWMEIGALQVKQLVGTDGPTSSAKSSELDLKFLNKTKVELSLSTPGKKAQKFLVEGLSNDLLLGNLGDLLGKLNKTVSISLARVTPRTGVPYGDLVGVMDRLRDHGIINLGVIPSKE